MANSEEIFGIIYDILLPLDIQTRYDLYFTDKRIAIVCMGSTNRIDYKKLGRRSLISATVGFAPTVLMYADEMRTNKKVNEEEIDNLSVDEILKLSKKSCFYTYDEIEKVKLVSTREPKFLILSEEDESVFSPTEEQFKKLNDLLPTIDKLKDKLILPNLRSKQILHEKESNLSLENKDLKKTNEELGERVKRLEEENKDLRSYVDSMQSSK
jgi:hypothetical protein